VFLCPAAAQEVLDWFEERSLRAYSISAGQSLLYNDIFPKHKERLGKKMSELVVRAALRCAHTGCSHWKLRPAYTVSITASSHCDCLIAAVLCDCLKDDAVTW
jgi:hypothetical protein